MNYLVLDNLRFHAFHGVMETENTVGGEYSVSFRIGYDFGQACETDDIQDAIDYGHLFLCVKEEMMQPSKLIEHLAKRIQDRVLNEFPQIRELTTRVTKHRPPVAGIMDGATIELKWQLTC